MAAILSDFEVVQPDNKIDQDKVSLWLAQAQAKATPDTFNEQMIQNFAVKKEYIQSRSFFCKDFGRSQLEDSSLFKLENGFNPGLKERSEFYRETAEKVFHQFYSESTQPPGEILHVSCTGYVSPSAGQKIIPQKNWSDTTGITHMYHMGCYAAMPAIKVAMSMSHNKNIDIIHTELCSLHFAIEAQTPEQTVVQTLFSDGAIKYTVSDESKAKNKGLRVLKMKEQIIPGSSDAMTWSFGGNNLEMTLHRSVPLLIRNNLEAYVRQLFTDAGFDYDRDKQDFIFAIHPGGPKIIQQIVELLKLDEPQVAHSKKILHERGNMSSATLPHVWDSIVNDSNIKSGKKILSVAFGPGLTVAGYIGEKL